MKIPAIAMDWLRKEGEVDLRTRLLEATQIAMSDAQVDGGHHKMWVIDQMLRALLGPTYEQVIAEYEDEWDCGIPP